jgi:arsenite methyltransferase
LPDLWRTSDQSGNSEAATWRNAVAEGVTERIQLQTGDMTEMALPDESFEIVVSSLAIHNIPTTAGRVKAIDEAVRVLRPNGRLVIADIRASELYRAHLLASGMASVSTVGLGWRGWWGSRACQLSL